MRNVLRLLMVAAMAVAAMAVAASPAAAQEEHPITVQEEDGAHCPDVEVVGHSVSGGCLLEGEGENIRLENPSLGFTSTCDNHYLARIQEDGSGWLFNQQLTQASQGTCLTEAEEETSGEPRPWPILSAGETPGSTHPEHMTVQFYVNNHVFGFEPHQTCTVEIKAEQHTHQNGEFEADQAGCAESSSHVTGQWTSTVPAGEPEVEIVH